MHMLRSCIITVLGLIATTVSADDYYPEVMFILDSSGSMAEQIDGKAKIAVAKEVMHQVVPHLDENVRVGLTAYGHRRPGDCSDIEVLIPAGGNDRVKLLSLVDQLQPRGRTPISTAILTVCGSLKMKDAETTILLVSDGIETCGGDPCQVVAELKKTGIRFVLHVVGFDVNAAAAAQLQCAAGAGGGQYFAANNSAELLKALKAVSKEVQEKVQQAAPAVAARVKTGSGLGKLKVTMPNGAEISLAHIHITDPESGKVKREVKEPKSSDTYPLRSAAYNVSLGFALPNYGQPTVTNLGQVRIIKGAVTELKLGSISFNVAKSLLEGDSIDQVLITDAGTNQTIVTVHDKNNGYYNFKPKPIVAGIYNVVLSTGREEDQPYTVASNVVVEPGKDTLVTLDSGIQLKKADDVLGWELVPAVAVSEDDAEGESVEGDSTTKVRPAIKIHYNGYGNRGRLWSPYMVPPGTYNLNVTLEGADEPLPAGEGIVIRAGELLQFDAGL